MSPRADLRLHGVGSAVLVRPDARVRVVLKEDQVYVKSEGRAVAASCCQCGVFLGLHFRGRAHVNSHGHFDEGVLNGPGLPQGSLLVPRAFVVRCSESQLQHLERARADHAAYVTCARQAACDNPMLEGSSTADDSGGGGGSLPASQTGGASQSCRSRWMGFGLSMLGVGRDTRRGEQGGAHAAHGRAQGGAAAGNSNPEQQPSPEGEDAGGDSPMRDVVDAREEAEEGARGGGTGEADSAAGSLRNSEGAEPGLEPGAEDRDGDELEEGAEGMEEEAAAWTSRAANVCGEASVSGESVVHACIPWGVRSHENEIRCATQGVLLRVRGVWALECFLSFSCGLSWSGRGRFSQRHASCGQRQRKGERVEGGRVSDTHTHTHTHLLGFRA